MKLGFLKTHELVLLAAFCLNPIVCSAQINDAAKPVRSTAVSIDGENFLINGIPTLAGKSLRGKSVEGLLPNSRMVQAIFDDLNPETRERWAYPDTGAWDPDRNTNEFIQAMPDWREAGLLAVTINLQGGSPEGYSQSQPWSNSAFEPNGSLRPDYLGRLKKVLNRSDELGMVVILGCFYFGQDQHLSDEAAVVRAVNNVVEWILQQGYTNVILEINNECNIQAYDHPVLGPKRVHELIVRAKSIQSPEGRRLLVSTSYGGGRLPHANVLRVVDFVLLHGNGVSDPAGIVKMVDDTRAMNDWRPMPIVFNEDDHYGFDQDENNFAAATSTHASWGFFDYRRKDEDFLEGFQSVPVDWTISSSRKKQFFDTLREIR